MNGGGCQRPWFHAQGCVNFEPHAVFADCDLVQSRARVRDTDVTQHTTTRTRQHPSEMSHYESLKVTELKTLLKDRGISATGLTKKAQYIQALEEEDAKNPAEDIAAKPDDSEQNDAPSTEKTGVIPKAEEAVGTTEGGAKSEKQELVDNDSTKPDIDQMTATTAAQVTGIIKTEPSPPDLKRKREEEVPDENQTPDKKLKAESNGDNIDPDMSSSGHKSAIDDHDTRESVTAQVAEDEEMTDAAKATGEIDDRAGEDETPSQHPPTNVLYVSGLMRPLQAQAFREYAESLADDRIDEIYLDAMKTHAFVTFRSKTSAAKLRSQLHNRVWPEESQRKPLWIDYVPSAEVPSWIDQERSAGRDARFEIVYNDGAARLVNVAASGTAPQRPGQGVPGAPSGPRAAQRPNEDARPPREETRLPREDARPPREDVRRNRAPQQQSESFNKLDQYFRFTTAKPKIYFQPIDREIVDRRLDELDRETSRDWQGGKVWQRSGQLGHQDELRRFTFEDADKIVDGGVDFGGFGRRQGAGGSANVNMQRGGRGGSYGRPYRS